MDVLKQYQHTAAIDAVQITLMKMLVLASTYTSWVTYTYFVYLHPAPSLIMG